MRWQISLNNRNFSVELPNPVPDNRIFTAKIGEKQINLRFESSQKTLFIVETGTNGSTLERPLALRNVTVHAFPGEAQSSFQLEIAGAHGQLVQTTAEKILPGQDNVSKQKTHKTSTIRSPITGKVLKVSVKDGQKVEKSDVLCIIEAMKMENKIMATNSGHVNNLSIKEGDNVTVGASLMSII